MNFSRVMPATPAPSDIVKRVIQDTINTMRKLRGKRKAYEQVLTSVIYAASEIKKARAEGAPQYVIDIHMTSITTITASFHRLRDEIRDLKIELKERLIFIQQNLLPPSS